MSMSGRSKCLLLLHIIPSVGHTLQLPFPDVFVPMHITLDHSLNINKKKLVAGLHERYFSKQACAPDIQWGCNCLGSCHAAEFLCLALSRHPKALPSLSDALGSNHCTLPWPSSASDLFSSVFSFFQLLLPGDWSIVLLCQFAPPEKNNIVYNSKKELGLAMIYK